MSFKNVDIESAMRRLADKRIEEAMREGKFSNLKGSGQPLDLEPMPANEDARLAWWAMKMFRQNDHTPEEIRWRKQIDDIRGEISASTTERRVRALVDSHNQLVRRINTLGTNALQSGVSQLSLSVELEKLRERTGVATGRPCSSRMCGCVNPADAKFCRRCGTTVA